MRLQVDRHSHIHVGSSRRILIAHISWPTIYAIGDAYCVHPPGTYVTRSHPMLRREGDDEQGIVVCLPQETEP